LQSLKEFGPIALLVVDPMARFYGSQENDNSCATMFVPLLERLKEELKTTVICVHHIAKGNPVIDEKSLESALHQDAARGASALTGAARWQLNLVPIPGKVAQNVGLSGNQSGRYMAARVSKNNYNVTGETFYIERIDEGLLIPASASPFQPDLMAQIKSKIIIVLKNLLIEGKPITKRGFCDIYTSQWKSDDRQISKSLVNAAIEDGLVSGDFEIYQGKNRTGKRVEYLKLKSVDGDENI
jgi:hypothetical protein